MAILGLVSTESLTRQTYWEENFRRKVFHQYPNGALSIIGLLSLMKTQEVNSPEFYWWEERFKRQITTTDTQGSSKGPFRLSADAVDGLDPFLPVVNVDFMLYVADTTLFRVGHVVKIDGLTVGNAGSITMRCVVTAITSGVKMKMRAISIPAGTSTGFDNGATTENTGLQITAIGTAFAQGTVNTTGEIYYLPDKFTNYTQIFRTPFSFSRNSMMTPTKFDETGVYREKAKQHSLYHMVEMERAFLFGERANYVKSGTVDSTTGAGLPEYKTGGVIGWFMPNWEAQYSVYRGGDGSGSGPAAVTLDTDDDKRLITNSAGTLNEATYDTYLERVFRKTNSVTNERLVICGTGFLKVVNQMYRSLGVLNLNVPSQDTYGMRIVQHDCPFGTLYYKTHPLFSEDSVMRNNALIIDVHNLGYRPFQKSDTFLRTGIQTPSLDGRQDEWLTEAGLEMRFPETFMYLQNIQNYAS